MFLNFRFSACLGMVLEWKGPQSSYHVTYLREQEVFGDESHTLLG